MPAPPPTADEIRRLARARVVATVERFDAEELDRLFRSSGWTLGELAMRAGLAVSTVHDALRGRGQVRSETLRALIEAIAAAVANPRRAST